MVVDGGIAVNFVLFEDDVDALLPRKVSICWREMHLRIVRSQFGVVDHRQGLLLASVNQMHASNKIDCIYVSMKMKVSYQTSQSYSLINSSFGSFIEQYSDNLRIAALRARMF